MSRWRYLLWAADEILISFLLLSKEVPFLSSDVQFSPAVSFALPLVSVFPSFMSFPPLGSFILVFCNFVIILILLSDGISLLSIQRGF